MKHFCVIIACCAVATAFGQGHDTAAPAGLTSLSPLIGTWVGKTSFNTGSGQPMVVDSTIKFSSIIGGHYIREEQVTIIPQRGAQESLNLIGFDKRTGDFRAWWFFDNSTGEPIQVSGRMNDNTLVLTGQGQPSGSEFRGTFTFKSKDELNYMLELKRDDKWRTLFTQEFKRKV